MTNAKLTSLQNYIDLLSGYAFKSDQYTDCEAGKRLLRGDNVVQGQLRWVDAKRWQVAESDDLSKYELLIGDIVLAMDRTWVKSGLKCARVSQSDIPCLLVQRVARIRGKNGLDSGYLYQSLQANRFIQYVKKVQTETAIPHISSQQINDFSILIPSLPEQKKVSQILSAWDSAIELAERLVGSRQLHKHALLQRLVDTRRTEWQPVKLGKLFKNCRTKGVTGLPTYSVTMDSGLVPRHSLDRKNDTTLEPEQHLLIEEGDIAYNMMRMWQGASGLATEPGLVSPAYVVIRSRGKVDPAFASYWFKMPRVVKKFQDYSHGLTKDRLRLYYKDFATIALPLPPLKLQKQIAEAMQCCDRELAVLERKVTLLKQQKKGLMQQLLTGKTRVKIPKGDA